MVIDACASRGEYRRGMVHRLPATRDRRRIAVVEPTPNPLAAWGSRLAEAFTRRGHVRVSRLVLRLFALIHFAAFASFAVQALGLIGSDGILPLADYVDALRDRLGTGPGAWWSVPFVFWISASDPAIEIAVGLGLVASLVLLAGRLPRVALATLYVLYLSLLYAGQRFMTYQWDILLVETTALAIFLPRHPTLGIWLLRWLLFRFMLLSGAVKLLSGDPNWANLTALDYYYETQPLPTVLAWYAHQLPHDFNRTCVAVMLFIELVLPFCIFGPRIARFAACAGFVLLELLIMLTGNYNFFNVLTLLLCLTLLDDDALARLLPQQAYDRLAQRVARPGSPDAAGAVARMRARLGGRVAALVAALLVGIGVAQLAGMFRGYLAGPVASVLQAVEPLRLVNTYGLFAVMTTERDEIVVEGSNDGRSWSEYEFKYKPGGLKRAPGWMIPHQPRLDWQMWFAALGSYESNPWFGHFLLRLLEGAPAVTALLANDPFAGTSPRYVRALRYRYRFSDAATRAATGQWWTRELTGMYAPAVELRNRLDDGREPSPH